MKTLWVVAICTLFSLCPLFSWGEEEKEEELGVIVVTATKTETPLKEVTTSLTVITEEEIREQQAETVLEVLRNVPGLDVVQSGSRGNATSVFIRGAESDQTLVLIDGVEVNSVTLGSFDFANLTTENIERIEILRGSGGTLYGSEAVGGVINIITKKGKGAPTAALSAEGGNGSTHREVASFSGSRGILGFSGSFAFIDTDGFRIVNDDYDNLTASLRLDTEPTRLGTGRLFFRYSNADVGLFNNNNFLGIADPDARQEQEFFLLRGEWEKELLPDWEYRLSASFTRDDSEFLDLPDAGDTGRTESDIASEILTGEFQTNYYWGERSVSTFGIEVEEKSADLDSLDPFSGVTSFARGRTNVAYYGQEQLRFLGRRLNLVGGFRVDDNDNFGTEVSPTGSAALLLRTTGTKLKGGYSEGFKAPSFNELFFPNFGNPDLGAERSQEFNAGFEQTFGEGRLFFEAIYFWRRTIDLIEAVLVDPENFIFQAQNIGVVKVQGVELSPSVALLPGLRLGGNYTYLDFLKGGRLPRRPQHRGAVTLNFSKGDLWQKEDFFHLNINVNIVGDRTDFEPTTGALLANGPYRKLDLAVSYSRKIALFPQFRRVTFFGKVENLTDENYQEALGFRARPVNFLVGVRGSF